MLGPGVILGDRQGYRLADSAEVCVDLDTAARYCGQAERKIATSPAIALAAAEQAIGLLAGDVALADEPYSSWADPARGELRGLLRRAGLAAAEAALATGEAVTAFLTRLTERAPVLLVVDDLQYAGQSTSEFIHYLGRHAQGSRLLVVATIRAEHDRQAGAALASVATRVEGARSARPRSSSSPARPGRARWPGRSCSGRGAIHCSWSRCCEPWPTGISGCPNRCAARSRHESGRPAR